MTSLFPFNFPLPTAYYLSAYIVTLAIHVVFMNYVLAGSAYVALKCLFGKRWDGIGTSGDDAGAGRLIFDTLRDWLPFATSAAITAGVGPLLFVQILYKKSFYTANLLLFHRWMAVVPVLIAGFYLLYLLKTPRLAKAGRWIRAIVAVAAFAAFAFTAWSWAENHLLSLDSKSWPGIYQKGGMTHVTAAAPVRVLAWVLGSFATMATMVAWQLRARLADNDTDSRPILMSLALHSNGGLLLAGFAAALSIMLAHKPPHPAADQLSDVASACGGPSAVSSDFYAIVLVVGIVLQLLAWMIQSRRRAISTGWLIVSSIGLGLALPSILVLRELERIARLDTDFPISSHAEAFRVGGLCLFLFFFLLNAALIALCIRIARRARR